MIICALIGLASIVVSAFRHRYLARSHGAPLPIAGLAFTHMYAQGIATPLDEPLSKKTKFKNYVRYDFRDANR